ncbi:MAG: patatin-like phospholipase family protein [Gemmatimonadota bacterium]
MRRSLSRPRGPATILALLLCAGPLAGQDVLVLSGGGARGLAHVGALLALDSLGHSPAAVVGTSMGAVVGALYAAGYDGQEVRRLVMAEDWVGAFAERPVMAGPARRPRIPLVRVAVRGWGADDPGAGLVPDWRINRTLVRFLFEPAARAHGDFDRLPRRFRAVAARLRDAELVVLSGGDLALAVRASMAVPGFFAPVDWDGEPLLDGGLADYLPVATARELGERVVAVDVTLPFADSLPVGALDVAQQAIQLFQVRARHPALEADLLVQPALPSGTSAAVFPEDPTELITIGREATLNALAGVRPDAVTPRPPGPLPSSVTNLRIAGAPAGLARLARTAMAPVLDGPLDPAEVLRGVDRLYATGLVDGVWPSVEPVAGDNVALILRLQPAPATIAAAAAAYDHDLGVRAWGAVRHAWLGSVPAEGALFVETGERDRRGSAELRVHPFTRLPLAVHGGLAGGESRVRRAGADGGERFVRRVGGWLGVEAFWPGAGLHTALSAPVEDVEAEEGADGLAAGVLFRAGTLPHLTVPVATGWSVAADVRGGEVPYRVAEARVTWPLPTGRDAWRAALVAEGALAGGQVPHDVRPSLGADRRVPGLEWDEAQGKALAVIGADVARSLGRIGWARLRARAGSARLGSCGLRACGRAGVHLGLFHATPLGPLAAGVALNDRGRLRFEVGVGPGF